MPLDPKRKYLIQDDSNQIYSWSKVLAKRKDMKSYDPVIKEKINDLATPVTSKMPIELQGKTFFVDEELYETLIGLLDYVGLLKAENEDLKQGVYTHPLNEKLLSENKRSKDKIEVSSDPSKTQPKPRKKPGPKPRN